MKNIFFLCSVKTCWRGDVKVQSTTEAVRKFKVLKLVDNFFYLKFFYVCV